MLDNTYIWFRSWLVLVLYHFPTCGALDKNSSFVSLYVPDGRLYYEINSWEDSDAVSTIDNTVPGTLRFKYKLSWR